MIAKIAEVVAFEAAWIFFGTLICRSVWRFIYGRDEQHLLRDKSWWRFPTYMTSFMLLLPGLIIGGLFFGAVIVAGWPK